MQVISVKYGIQQPSSLYTLYQQAGLFMVVLDLVVLQTRLGSHSKELSGCLR
jgi:hypothetical protein